MTAPEKIDKQLPALDGERVTLDLDGMDPDDWPVGMPAPEDVAAPVGRDVDEDEAWLAASKAQWGA